ncbi:MAG: DUF167 domain-containing protein [Deltaproteobacteria bacterium]|nr:DUF167 domain-containing protein [Deltaproteobacteria bacterium]
MRAHSGSDVHSESACARIQVKLSPRSSRNEVAGREGDTYRIRVTSPPVEGLANQALIDLLSKRLKIGKSAIRILSGKTSRLKRILISGLSREEVSERLEERDR